MGTNGNRKHRLGREAIHTYWDRTLPPRLTIESGDVVVFETREPSQADVARELIDWDGSGDVLPASDDLLALVRGYASQAAATGLGTEQRGHALTGPVAVRGAEPGDALKIEVLRIEPGEWGWTSAGPEHGSLLDTFTSDRALKLWDLRAGDVTWFNPRVRIPIVPFCGVMGVAPAEPGRLRTAPPRSVGGNMDIRQLTAGSTLYLPVQVPEALFSVGDAHAAQGDGEVCGTAIEMDATVTLRIELVKGMSISGPQFLTANVHGSAGTWFACSAHGNDLYSTAREAMRSMLTYLESEHALTRTEAVILSSVCVDLRISQIVNAETYTVTAMLPLSVFVDGDVPAG